LGPLVGGIPISLMVWVVVVVLGPRVVRGWMVWVVERFHGVVINGWLKAWWFKVVIGLVPFLGGGWGWPVWKLGFYSF